MTSSNDPTIKAKRMLESAKQVLEQDHELFEPDTQESSALRHARYTMQELPDDSHFRATSVLEKPIGDSPVAVETPLFMPSARPPMGLLRLIHDGQTEATCYPILKDRFRIGRLDGDLLVPFDLLISGKHAELQRRRRGNCYFWVLVDLKSTNGTFIQTKTAELQNGDELFLGRERYRFVIHDGNVGLLHIVKGTGEQWWPKGTRFEVGRSFGTELKSFSSDPFLDPKHAEIHRTPEGNWVITDNNSRNGTWFRIDEAELSPFCSFQIGEQRFSFSWNADHRVCP